jgi:hypothetical protein
MVLWGVKDTKPLILEDGHAWAIAGNRVNKKPLESGF